MKKKKESYSIHWIDKIYVIGPIFLFMLCYLIATCYGDTFKIMHNCSQSSILTLFEIINIPPPKKS